MEPTSSDTRYLVAANWKTNPESLVDAFDIFDGVKSSVRTLRSTDVVLAPPLPFIDALSAEYGGKKIQFAAQDLSVHTAGSHTGESTGEQIASIGAEYVIVGHSERRRMGETDEVVKEKTLRALASGLRPIVCIGEHDRDKDGSYLSFIQGQIKAVFFGMSKDWLEKTVIAYEPIWAIGKTARESVTPHALHETAIYIRKVLADLFGKRHALSYPILYGGSVEPVNASDLISNTGINGFLVGHASLEPESFKEILEAVELYAKGQ